MILQAPFAISARLLPAIQFGDAWLSFDPQAVEFYLDLPDASYTITEFRPGYSHNIQMCFADILSFMSAAGGAVMWGERDGEDVFADPDSNANLFEREVSLWCRGHYDDLGAYSHDLEEGPELIT